jgi:Ran GTPase-activating protein (RanGAP) involved in mRNA processing and transport/uncharacterized tellurite resistance protein B-like protein
MHFDRDYPNNPPELTLCTRIEHPNIFDNRVCLDMLEKRDEFDVNKYEGWSSAYTVQSILIQLQAFLFEAEPSNVLKNIENPKDYEKKKKEWLSGVKWSVEQSRSYKDQSVSHFPPRSPWPPLHDEKMTTKSLSMDMEKMIKDELICFYTRQTFEEDCLGYGISYAKNLRTGELKAIKSLLSFLSLRAFINHNLRLSANNEKFTHFMPIFINPNHGKKAMHLAKRSMSIICTGNHKNFQPDMALQILPKLMSSMVVEIMSGKKHASLSAFKAYCYFHRMLLEFVKEFPELKQKANQIVKDFIKDESKRHKETGVPNLGEFLASIPITDYRWEDIRDAYIQESFARNVYWLLNKYPELEKSDCKEFTDDDRISYSFESSKTSIKLLMFHVFFLENVARPKDKEVEEIIKQYDENYGRPSTQLEDMFISACENINECKQYKQFFSNIGKKIGKEEIIHLLKSSIQASKEKGYHGSKASVLSPEQFAKESKFVDLEKMYTKNEENDIIFDQNEDQWREMCSVRWGLTELPVYLQNFQSPWRKLYLQNNLQDLVSNLNDAPDLCLFHKIVDLSFEIPRLEVTMFEPTNIKSKYHFLTILLTKLKSLNTLTIKKGDTGLGTKGFKALIKGMAKNSGNLEALVLEYCSITAESVEELTKSKLVSGNLRKLILKGNPLGDDGAKHLALFLRQHHNLPHLTELDLSDCKIGKNGANAIAEALLVKKELKVLHLLSNPFFEGLEIIFRNLSYSPSITEVNVSKVSGKLNDSGNDSLKKLLELSVTLRKLNMWHSKFGNLSSMVFSALENNSSLKELDLDSTNFNDLASLGKALCKNKTLEILHLGNNGITCNNVFNFLEELKKGKFEVKYLNLSNNSLHVANKEKYLDTIGQLIDLGKNLTHVDLSSCKLSKEHMEAIGESLKPSHKLQIRILNLKKNNIGKSGLKPLIEALKINNILEVLDISGNDIGVIGSQCVAAFLEYNKNIKTLNLFGNLIEIEGALNIVKALEVNNTLTDIDLGLNRIRSRGADAIADLLSRNKTIRRIGLKHNHINNKSGIKLVKAITDNKDTALNYISLAGNFLSVSCRSDIAVLFNNKGPKGFSFDLAKLVEVKDMERMERTIYISPLPASVTEQQIKKLFYQNQCGVCLNVSIHTHKKVLNYNKSKYAFLEFAHVDSVALAMRLVNNHKNLIAGNEVRIIRAGVQEQNDTKKKTPNASSDPTRREAGRGRGRRGRGTSLNARRDMTRLPARR